MAVIYSAVGRRAMVAEAVHNNQMMDDDDKV
jgi:hypothetical protein